MFSANFRDVLTEPEKGALHEALKEVRRKEFDEKVMRELLKDNMENQLKEANAPYFTSSMLGGGFGQAQISNGGTGSGGVISNTSATSLRLGKETLSEEDIKRMKEATTSPSLFK
jgi:hypothetical protein